jgi:hypothetical protein
MCRADCGGFGQRPTTILGLSHLSAEERLEIDAAIFTRGRIAEREYFRREKEERGDYDPEGIGLTGGNWQIGEHGERVKQTKVGNKTFTVQDFTHGGKKVDFPDWYKPIQDNLMDKFRKKVGDERRGENDK